MGIAQSQECPKCPPCEKKEIVIKTENGTIDVEKMLRDKINSTTYTNETGSFMLKTILNNPSKEELVNKVLLLLCAKENANTFVNDEIINLLITKNDSKKTKIVSEIKGLDPKYKQSLEEILNKKKYLKYKKKYLKHKKIM